jgi:iron-sulfur cluster repair protein YtfE (RIC family)
VELCPQLSRLSAEHARWLARVAGPAGEDEASRGARLLALWDTEIFPHCRAEEDVLLPELGRRLSEADAIIVFTLGDHQVLRRMARDLRETTGAAQATAAATLLLKLEEHVAFEERTLFPALQETLGCHRLAALDGELARSGRSPVSRPADGPPAAHAAPTKGSTS